MTYVPKVQISLTQIVAMMEKFDTLYAYGRFDLIRDFVNDVFDKNNPVEIETVIYLVKLNMKRKWQDKVSHLVSTRINFS